MNWVLPSKVQSVTDMFEQLMLTTVNGTQLPVPWTTVKCVGFQTIRIV